MFHKKGFNNQFRAGVGSLFFGLLREITPSSKSAIKTLSNVIKSGTLKTAIKKTPRKKRQKSKKKTQPKKKSTTRKRKRKPGRPKGAKRRKTLIDDDDDY